MKKIIYPALIAIIFGTSAFTVINNTDWKVQEENYMVKFSGKKVEGIFKGLKASIQFDEADVAHSKISASIDANTANTGNGIKNKHVAEGLGADTYPQIKFESTSISKKGNSYEALGKLTIKSITKEIILPFTFSKNETGGVFAGNFSVIPKEYDVTKSSTPDVIEINLNIPVTK